MKKSMDKKGTPQDSAWGFNNDGKSTTAFGPTVESTPNKVEAVDEGKSGKGNISGGIEDKAIFDKIDYTTLVQDFEKPSYKSVDQKVWNGIDYSFDDHGFPADKDTISAKDEAAGSKDKKVTGSVSGKKKAEYVGKPMKG